MNRLNIILIFITGVIFVNCNLKEVNPDDVTTAKFTVSNNNCNAPCDPGFTNTSTNADTYQWDFGDGGTSNEKNPSHTYTSGGTYNVKLSVTGSFGSDDETVVVTINDAGMPPKASFTLSNADCKAPCDPGFTNTSVNAVSFDWDFGDGNSSTDENPSHIYDLSGDYDVTLTVTDGDGNTDDTTATITIKANTWTKTFGGSGFDAGFDILLNSEGYFISGYETPASGTPNPVIYKLDQDGIQIDKGTYAPLTSGRTWPRIIYNSNGDIVMTSAKGGFFIGTTNNYVDIINPISLNSSDQEEISITYPNAITNTSNGEYVVAGSYANFFISGTAYGVMFRLSSSLDSLWRRSLLSTQRAGFTSIEQLPSFSYAVAGYAQPASGSSSSYQMIMAKVSSSGTSITEKIEIGNLDRTEYARDFVIDANGNYIVAGYSLDTVGLYDEPYLAKVSPTFSLIKEVDNYGFSGTEEVIYDIEKTSDGNFVVAGYSYTPGGTSDFFLMKVDTDLNEIWSRFLGTPFDDYGYRVKEATDGGFILTGYTAIDENNRDIYVIKTDSEGNVE